MIGSFVLLPVGITEPLLSLNTTSYFLICLSAIFSAAGNYLLVLANRWAEATLIAPLVYSQLISASVAGLVVFGDWPDGLSFVGLSLILVSGFGSLMLQKAKWSDHFSQVHSKSRMWLTWRSVIVLPAGILLARTERPKREYQDFTPRIYCCLRCAYVQVIKLGFLICHPWSFRLLSCGDGNTPNCLWWLFVLGYRGLMGNGAAEWDWTTDLSLTKEHHNYFL